MNKREEYIKILRDEIKHSKMHMEEEGKAPAFYEEMQNWIDALSFAVVDMKLVNKINVKIPDGWVPVGNVLPRPEEMVLVSCRTKKGVATVNRAYYSNGAWHGSGSMSGVEAWMPLPEPYEEGGE